jgi:thiol-disulfide isomerase/thioredoxin
MNKMPDSPLASYGIAAALSAILGFAAVYVTLGQPDNAVPGRATPAAISPPVEALPKGPGANALSQGEMAAFVFKKEPETLPEIVFLDAAGAQRTLAEWKGKVVLLNLWATWCAPCRKEMPALDRLQKELGSERFEVVALAVDRGGAEAARKFLDQIKVESLKLYVDPSAKAASQLKAVGMPTTLLVDREGREIGRLTGPAEWDSAEAKRLIAAAGG